MRRTSSEKGATREGNNKEENEEESYFSFRDRMAGTDFRSVQYYDTWNVWRWEAAELLRRCVAVVTPSARNKQLFSIFFPEVYVSSAPLVRNRVSVDGAVEGGNRSSTFSSINNSNISSSNNSTTPAAQQHKQQQLLQEQQLKPAVCDVQSKVTPIYPGGTLRLVILGAVSIGKGARIAERVADEGFIRNSIKVR